MTVSKRLSDFLNNLFYDNDIQEEYYVKMRNKSSSTSAFAVGLVAAVGGFLYGYDTGLINDILEMKYITTHFPKDHVEGFSVHERAIITAILSLGTFCGAITAPLISDNYGRKFSIIVSSGILFTIGNILQVSSNGNVLLCVGRYVSGLAIGILSAIVPLYQAEASPRWVRGSVVYLYQWAITWGLLVASAVCQGTRNLDNSGSYRIPIGLQFLFALILCGGMLFLPESPRYYVQKDKLDKALASLSKLRRIEQNDPDLIEELVEIKASYDYEMSFGKTKLIDCFKNGGGRNKQVLRMITGMGIHVFQQCSGINFIFYYGVNFYSSTGVSNYYLMSFITYAVNTLFTIPGILLIEIIGRRLLLLGGGIGMTISNLIIAIVGVSVSDDNISSKVCIAFSCVFIAFFAASWGGGVWALTSDLFGISIRQKAISITASTNWLVNFVFAFITPYLIDTGEHTAALGTKIFFIWGGLNFMGVIFVYLIVYETKGLKLEEVDYMYKVCSGPRESKKFQSTKIHYDNIDTYQFDFMQPPYQPIEPRNAKSSESPTTGPSDISSETDGQRLDRSDQSDQSSSESDTDSIPPHQPIFQTQQINYSEVQKSDYEKYLESLKTDDSSHLESKNSRLSRGNSTQISRLGSGSQLGSKKYESSSTSINVKGTNIIAPFFEAPPSDSDSDCS
ncbi:high glucose sensor Rgt2p [[Candida] jaroonii]|uniref:High glucose sensor Rgt2p n=1 Tax=[Candida] jaroonii TaxID=467808 RepID=A0ACA9Y4B1_9ASCO|nr:high glucose sensor Rgt2p [[Candida] jaroonii]